MRRCPLSPPKLTVLITSRIQQTPQLVVIAALNSGKAPNVCPAKLSVSSGVRVVREHYLELELGGTSTTLCADMLSEALWARKVWCSFRECAGDNRMPHGYSNMPGGVPKLGPTRSSQWEGRWVKICGEVGSTWSRLGDPPGLDGWPKA